MMKFVVTKCFFQKLNMKEHYLHTNLYVSNDNGTKVISIKRSFVLLWSVCQSVPQVYSQLTMRSKVKRLNMLDKLIKNSAQNVNVDLKKEGYLVLSMSEMESYTKTQLLDLFSKSDIHVVPHHTYTAPEFSAATCQNLGADIYEYREVGMLVPFAELMKAH